MRLDHLLSKEKEDLDGFIVYFSMYFYSTLYLCIDGAVAQLARAPALQAGGQEFDSP